MNGCWAENPPAFAHQRDPSPLITAQVGDRGSARGETLRASPRAITRWGLASAPVLEIVTYAIR
jgi:hypothetical protein